MSLKHLRRGRHEAGPASFGAATPLARRRCAWGRRPRRQLQLQQRQKQTHWRPPKNRRPPQH